VAEAVESSVGDAGRAHRGLEDAASVVVGVDPCAGFADEKRDVVGGPGPGLASVPEPLRELLGDGIWRRPYADLGAPMPL
jgi:hypothetical protein